MKIIAILLNGGDALVGNPDSVPDLFDRFTACSGAVVFVLLDTASCKLVVVVFRSIENGDLLELI